MNAGRTLRDYCGMRARFGVIASFAARAYFGVAESFCAVAFFTVLAFFVAAAVFIASCKSGGDAALPGKSEHPGHSQSDSLSIGDPSLSSSDASSVDELEAVLRAELARLGVDIERAVAKAPTGSENKVFDLAAAVVDPDGPTTTRRWSLMTIPRSTAESSGGRRAIPMTTVA